MRAISFLVVGAVAAAAGCSRPVLYYPTPARATAPARAHCAAVAAAAAESRTPHRPPHRR